MTVINIPEDGFEVGTSCAKNGGGVVDVEALNGGVTIECSHTLTTGDAPDGAWAVFRSREEADAAAAGEDADVDDI